MAKLPLLLYLQAPHDALVQLFKNECRALRAKSEDLSDEVAELKGQLRAAEVAEVATAEKAVAAFDEMFCRLEEGHW